MVRPLMVCRYILELQDAKVLTSIRMWQTSSQQYYYLGCEGCKEHFPLYTPGSDDWEDIWIHTKIVKCPKCGHEQDKLAAQERGKWVALKDAK